MVLAGVDGIEDVAIEMPSYYAQTAQLVALRNMFSRLYSSDVFVCRLNSLSSRTHIRLYHFVIIVRP